MKNNMGSHIDFPDFEQFVSSFDNNNSSNTNDSSNSFNNSSTSNPFANIDMSTMFRIKQIVDNLNTKKDNPRSNLLLSLKPYLKPSRRQKIDQYVQLFNMGDIIENMNFLGGENTK